MERKLIVAALLMTLTALTHPLASWAQDSAEFKRFEEEKTLPKALYAPTVPYTPLAGPRHIAPGTCERAPEVCEARKEYLRRRCQACKDDPANCGDPVFKRYENDCEAAVAARR